MKRIKMAMMALSAITSIGSAFAFSPAARPAANTYYAVRSGDQTFSWTMTNPAVNGLSCQATLQTAICNIVTENQPQPDQIPAGHVSTGRVFK